MYYSGHWGCGGFQTCVGVVDVVGSRQRDWKIDTQTQDHIYPGRPLFETIVVGDVTNESVLVGE